MVESRAATGVSLLLAGCLMGVLAANAHGGDGVLLTDAEVDALSEFPQAFQLTDRHLALLRRSVISWDPTEVGAPAIDPEKPFGSRSVRKDVAQAAQLSPKDAKGIKAFYAEMGHALQTLLWYGELAPGVYRVPHPLKGRRSWLDGLTGDGDPPPPETIEIRFEETHRKLLDRAHLRWTNWPEEEADDGLVPTPGIDPKRPYGDRTYFTLDMAEILGMPIRADEGEPMTEEQQKHLVALHHEMKHALQVFVVKAQVAPGAYRAKE